MNYADFLTLIKAPYISEKSVNAPGDYRQYAFKVARDANKPSIKQAIEELFKVKVKSVRVCNVKSKPARFGQIEGRSKAWKKAYVILQKGQEIDLSGQGRVE